MTDNGCGADGGGGGGGVGDGDGAAGGGVGVATTQPVVVRVKQISRTKIAVFIMCQLMVVLRGRIVNITRPLLLGYD